MRSLRTRLRVSLGLVVIALVVVGCGGVSVGADDQTRALIDDAISKLTNQSSDWQRIVTETRDKLPKDAQSFVRTELATVLDRSVRAAGSEVRCIIDFIGQRVLDDLQRLRALLLHQEPPPRWPTICGVNPSLVRMSERNADPSRFEAVEIHGYNFDSQPSPQVLLTDNNVVSDVTMNGSVSNLTYQSHYQMTLNLGGNGVKLSATSQVIALAWNGTRLSEIPVIQPEPPPCPTRIVNLDNIGIHEARAALDSGDPEFGTNGPLVSAGVTLTNRESHVDAELWIRAEERNNGDTVGWGRTTFSIHSAPSNWRILRIVTPTSDTIPSYHDTTWEVDVRLKGGDGPVSVYELWGDTHGWDVEPDRDDGTRVRAHFRRVAVEEVRTKDCK